MTQLSFEDVREDLCVSMRMWSVAQLDDECPREEIVIRTRILHEAARGRRSGRTVHRSPVSSGDSIRQMRNGSATPASTSASTHTTPLATLRLNGKGRRHFEKRTSRNLGNSWHRGTNVHLASDTVHSCLWQTLPGLMGRRKMTRSYGKRELIVVRNSVLSEKTPESITLEVVSEMG